MSDPDGKSDHDVDARVARARAQVVGALSLVRDGRLASAERMLRRARGVLERRRRYAGAARAAATLSLVFRERGEVSRAGEAHRQAQLLFDAARHSDSDGQTEEDLAETQVLLRPTAHDEPATADSRTGATCAAMSAFARDVEAFLRSAEDDDGSLGGLCAWLRRRLAARIVSVHDAERRTPPLASAGPSRPDDGRALARLLATYRTDGGMAAAVTVGRERVATVPVADNSAPVGLIVARWTRMPGDPLWTVDGLMRVCAALSLGEVTRVRTNRRNAEDIRSHGLIGDSPVMRALRQAICEASTSSCPVLIEGETGAGKELVAQALHRSGPRRTHRFCPINCAALTDKLFEAELFGHTRGAFTGALVDRVGLFGDADHGTLFLDEVGELSPRAQAKLLRTVQEGEIRRLGDNRSRRVDVRVVAATNRSLDVETHRGRFRQDLLYRLAVVRIRVPPLRAHLEDIDGLVANFWSRALTETGGRATLAAETVAALRRHLWPGNVRELQNIVTGLAVRAPRRGAVGPAHLPPALAPARDVTPPPTLAAARREFDRQFVREALQRAGGRPSIAAQALGISRQGLAKLIARLGD